MSSKQKDNGYIEVKLTKEGKRRFFSIHRLVAIMFIPNPENKPQVNHVDGDKKNNNISNLEWNTKSENQQHAYDTGLRGIGENHGRAKISDKDVEDIRYKYSLRKSGIDKKYTLEYIAREYNVTATHISYLVRNLLRIEVI